MIKFNYAILFIAIVLIIASVLYANMIDETKDVNRDDVDFP